MSLFDEVCEQQKHHLVDSRCGICLVDDDGLVNSKAEYDLLKRCHPNAVAATDEHMKRVNSVVVCPLGHIFDNRCINAWEKTCNERLRIPVCPFCSQKLLDINLRKPVYAPPAYVLPNKINYRALSPPSLFDNINSGFDGQHHDPFDVDMPPVHAVYLNPNVKVCPASPTPQPEVKSKY